MINWVYNYNFLFLKPYSDNNKAVDIFNSFSHGEWDVQNIYLQNIIENNKTLLKYTIELNRFSHYYLLSIGMTITLVYVSIIIMFLPSDNISRTSTAVFIPLTILALQLTIVDKVPVVGYFTIMDKFFLSCFVCSMFVSIESGIIYALINIKNKSILKKVYEFLNRNDSKKKDSNENDSNENDSNENDSNENINNASSDNVIIENDNNLVRTLSYRKAITNETENFSNMVYRVINHNDKNLFMDKNEQKALNHIKLICKYIDNFFRIITPLIFTIYISVILN